VTAIFLLAFAGKLVSQKRYRRHERRQSVNVVLGEVTAEKAEIRLKLLADNDE
jgi:hypothetical protein